MATPSRYDVHADWFLKYTHDWTPTAADYLPADLSGQRVLDLACGYGPLSRILADRGASVTGVDLSGRLLTKARDIDTAEPHDIHYLDGDATVTTWWDGEPFDGVVCNMALMDIDDLDAALHTVATVVKPAGWFTFTLHHPCFPGAGTTLPSWPPEAGYATEGWWTTGESGVRGHVGAHHRELSTYLNAVLAAGFDLVQLDEPDTPLPHHLIVHWQRPI